MRYICALAGVAFLVMGCHCPSPKDVAAPAVPFEAQDSGMNCDYAREGLCFDASDEDRPYMVSI